MINKDEGRTNAPALVCPFRSNISPKEPITMQKINQSIRLLFAFALALSVGFPAGVLCIVFGAANGIPALLVTGIVLAVLGFYVMPILWLKFADRRHDRALLLMIEHDRLLTVADLAAQTGYSFDDVRNRIKRLIASRALVGYLLRDDLLLSADAKKHAETNTKKCSCCGAPMTFDGIKFLCEYCQNVEQLG